MILTHKIRIYPNKTMQQYLTECFGYRRFCYNRGLSVWNNLYNEGNSVTIRIVRDTIKRNKENFMYDWEKLYTPNIMDNSLNDLEKSFKSFFNKKGKYPKYKSKRKANDTFTINRKSDSTIRIIDKKLLLPKFPHPIKMSEQIRFKGKIKTCTITKKANKYFASFAIEVDENISLNKKRMKVVGIDSNIGHFDISSKEGYKHRYNFPLKEIKVYYNKISFYQRKLSRKSYGSKKYNELKTKIQNIYLRIHNIKLDWLHRFTTTMIKRYEIICIEDLNVQGMLSNRHLSKSISQSLFYTFKVLLQYKSKIYENILIIADKWFPSTQRCSCCGNIKSGKNKLKLKDRTYICNKCNNAIDRDYNSSLNLKWYALNN